MKLEPLIDRYESNVYIANFKEVLIGTGFPLALIGSIFYIVANPPRGTNIFIFKIWLSASFEIKSQLMIPYYFTLGLISVIVTFMFSYKLAQHFKIEALPSAVISVVSYFVVCFPGGASLNFTLDDLVKITGPNGILVSFLISIACIRLLRVIFVKKIYFNINTGVPSSLSEGLKFLTLAMIIVPFMWAIGWIIGLFLGQPLPSGISTLCQYIVSANSDFLRDMLGSITSSLMYFIGMDGGTIKQPVSNMLINQGGFIIILPLVILYALSYSKNLKHVGRTSIIPCLFNMPYSVLFAIPLLLNPIYIIPMILCPLINTMVNYLLIISGYLTITVEATNTMPALLSGYFVTSGQFIGIAAQIINFILSFFIYYPFFRYHEAKLLSQYGTQLDIKMASKSLSSRMSNIFSRIIPSLLKKTSKPV